MKSFSQQLIDEARAAFIEGDYQTAEPILNQPTLLNSKNPEVLQMLATIYYDQGKFNKAISINTSNTANKMLTINGNSVSPTAANATVCITSNIYPSRLDALNLNVNGLSAIVFWGCSR